MKKIISGLVFSSTFLLPTMALAENAYIVDQLLVGLHQEKNIDSPIIKVLATGTQVEILQREGDFAEIREQVEGKTGWVDASYLMLEVPAKIQLAELQEKLKTMEAQSSVQATQDLQQQHEQQVADLNKQIEDLKQNVASEKLSKGELEGRLSQQEKQLAQLEASADNGRISELEKENTELQKRLEMISQEQAGPDGQTASLPAFLRIFSPLKERSIQIILAVIALLAFLFGRRWEDQKIRKRHGGFRV